MQTSPASMFGYEMPDSARAVFRRLSRLGPTTRPQLGAELGLSRPTMSVAMTELARHELVTESGESRGRTGRTAAMYSIAPQAGHVLAVELGASRVRAEVHSLDFLPIAAAEEKLSSYRRTVTQSMVAKAAVLVERVLREAGNSHGPLCDVVIVAPTLPAALREPDRRPYGVGRLRERLRLPSDVAALVENNVNCAAVAEHRVGIAKGCDNFLYLQVGVKIGAGFVINGHLHAGAHGAAGEIGMFPYPWGGNERPQRMALEHYLGSDDLMKRCHARWPATAGPAPRTAAGLFELAATGNAAANDMVAEHSRDIGRLVAAAMSMVDPELVVLGGGVGQNEMILTEVRQTVGKLTWDTDIQTGTLGERATITGALHLSVDRALQRML